MSAKKDCRNCDRNMAIMQDGLCGGCFNRAKGLKGEDREKALAQAREDFKGKGPLSGGNRIARVKTPREKAKIPISSDISTRKQDRKPKNDNYHPEKGLGIELYPAPPGEIVRLPDVQVSRDMLETFADDHTIVLHFDNGDEDLLKSLKTTAKRFRREPSQQILWMLQHGLLDLDKFIARHVSDLSGVTE
jgi:hypothetical protein